MYKCIITLTITALMLFTFGCEESAQLNDDAKVQDPAQVKAIQQVLEKWKQAYEVKDLEGMLAPYSDDYVGSRGERKQQVRDFIKSLLDQGALENTTMIIEDAEIEIDGDTATVAPITYSGNWGEMAISNTFKKEGSAWKTVTAEQYY